MRGDRESPFSRVEVATYYGVRVPGLKQTHGREWRCRCPIHRGSKRNLAINAETGLWFCYSQCGRGGDVLAFEMALSRWSSLRRGEVCSLSSVDLSMPMRIRDAGRAGNAVLVGNRISATCRLPNDGCVLYCGELNVN